MAEVEKVLKQLKEVVTGFIYEYYREDNGEVVYRGSTEHPDIEKVDEFHRKGNFFKLKGMYSWTHFRINLRRPIGQKIKIRKVTEESTMTRMELLYLEKVKIREKIQDCECYLNNHDDPLKAFVSNKIKLKKEDLNELMTILEEELQAQAA